MTIEKTEQDLAIAQVNEELSNETRSSLGPLLWNVYQNDLFYTSVKSQLSAYADDHQIYRSNLNLHIVIDRNKNSGEDASRWYETNFLKGNYSKYKQ